MSVITEKIISSLAEYTTFINTAMGAGGRQLWYRGSGKASHKLTPSLFRHPTTTDPAAILDLEAKLIARFKQRWVPFQTRELSSDWEFLFFMQHFGVPTRLLDWSENPYVSLYFAVTSAEWLTTSTPPGYTEDAAVWVLEPEDWNRQALKHISFSGGVLSVPDDELKGYAPLSKPGLMNILPVALHGTHNSPRIVAQRGVFVIFGKSTEPMEKVVHDHNFPSNCLTKLILPKEKIEEISKSLFAIGFLDSVIFPDLPGLAKEIKRTFGFGV